VCTIVVVSNSNNILVVGGEVVVVSVCIEGIPKKRHKGSMANRRLEDLRLVAIGMERRMN
jgi:hypothetical protein